MGLKGACSEEQGFPIGCWDGDSDGVPVVGVFFLSTLTIEEPINFQVQPPSGAVLVGELRERHGKRGKKHIIYVTFYLGN